MGKKRCKICKKLEEEDSLASRRHLDSRAKIYNEWKNVCEIPWDTDNMKGLFVCFRHFQSREVEEFSYHLKPKPGI